MNVHKNARLTPHSRADLVRRVREHGQTPKAVRKWLARFQAEGSGGLYDRSSRPHKLRQPTPATVSRVLRRLGLNSLKALDPAPPIRRYERDNPGERLHIDIKKPGRFERPGPRVTGPRVTGHRPGHSNRRGVGWEDVHVWVDAAARVAFVQILPDEKKHGAVAFLNAAVAYYQGLGISVERVMTDNGSCDKSHDFRDACEDLGLKHIRTRPDTPKTNGKAERFIQTALREWAAARAYPNSGQRGVELLLWLHRDDRHRPPGSLKYMTPIGRLRLTEDNLLRLHS